MRTIHGSVEAVSVRIRWSMVGAIAAVLSVALMSIFFFIGQQGRAKRLEVDYISLTAIDASEFEFGGAEIRVTHGSETINSYASIQVRVSNTGSTPISGSEYESPLVLVFYGVEKILSAQKLASNPHYIEIGTEIRARNELVLPEILLNPGDWYTLEIELSALQDEELVFAPQGRIAGISEIAFKAQPLSQREGMIAVKDPPDSDLRVVITWSYTVLGFLAAIAVGVSTAAGREGLRRRLERVGLSLAVSAAVLALASSIARFL